MTKQNIKVKLYNESSHNTQQAIKAVLQDCLDNAKTTRVQAAEQIAKIFSSEYGKPVYFNRNHVTALLKALNMTNTNISESEANRLAALHKSNEQRKQKNIQLAVDKYTRQGGSKSLFINTESKTFKIIDFKNKYNMDDTQIKNLFAAYDVSMTKQARYTWKILHQDVNNSGMSDADLQDLYDNQGLTIPQIASRLSKLVNRNISDKQARNLSKKLGFSKK